MLADDPAVPFRFVAFHAPALDSGVVDGQILHPLHIAQVADAVLDVDMLGSDDDFLGEDAHGSSLQGRMLPAVQKAAYTSPRGKAMRLLPASAACRRDFACLSCSPGVEGNRDVFGTGGKEHHGTAHDHGMGKVVGMCGLASAVVGAGHGRGRRAGDPGGRRCAAGRPDARSAPGWRAFRAPDPPASGAGGHFSVELRDRRSFFRLQAEYLRLPCRRAAVPPDGVCQWRCLHRQQPCVRRAGRGRGQFDGGAGRRPYPPQRPA